MVITNKKTFSLIVVVIFFMALFFLLNQKAVLTSNKIVEDIHFINIGGKILKVELAITPEGRTKGLSGRNELKEDESILFVFDYPSLYPFWMKDMNFPIDIIWIDENYKIVFIKKNAQPESYPETFSPPVESSYVLEVNALFSDKNNLKVGDIVQFLSS